MCCMPMSFSSNLQTGSSSWSSLLTAQVVLIASPLLPSFLIQSWCDAFSPHALLCLQSQLCGSRGDVRGHVLVHTLHSPVQFAFFWEWGVWIGIGSIALASLYSVTASVWQQHTRTSVLSPKMAFSLESNTGCLTMKKSKNPLWWLPFFHHMGFFLSWCYHVTLCIYCRISIQMQG